MVIGILGRKVGMTQIYDDKGKVIPVTVIQAGPCHVLQVKTAEKDGYEAVQLGFLDKPRRLAGKCTRGQVAERMESKRARRRSAGGGEGAAKAGCEPKRFIRELRGEVEGYSVGAELGVGVFHPQLQKLAADHNSENEAQPGDEKYVSLADADGRAVLKEKAGEDFDKALEEKVLSVDVVGVSKGRGTAGAMKRHNFAGQRASHGVKKCHRHLGGTGCSAYPSRLFKGKKMPGRYGNARCTVRNLKVERVDLENNLLVVRGAVPGPNGGLLIVKETNKLG